VSASVASDLEFERVDLGNGTWIDLARGWVRDPDEVYTYLTEHVPWKQGRLWRYEKYIEEPRLSVGYGSRTLPHPVLVETQRQLQRRYNVPFDGAGLNWYRDGNDCQAFHRDRDMRYCENTLVAILTFGARRPWLMRRRTRADKWIAENNGAEVDLSPSAGDLFILGGRAQADWEHSVPQVRGAEGRLGRISVQWRWTSRTGRPEVGASYRAPRNFSRR
jgi:alkylated DNA repair dioxygenase AlkB